MTGRGAETEFGADGVRGLTSATFKLIIDSEEDGTTTEEAEPEEGEGGVTPEESFPESLADTVVAEPEEGGEEDLTSTTFSVDDKEEGGTSLLGADGFIHNTTLSE